MKFAILGCDFLGKKIARYFQKEHAITSVVYLSRNIHEAEKEFQKAIYLSKTPQNDINQIISENDVFIITHSLALEDREHLRSIATAFKNAAKNHPNKKLIYLSSIEIYGDQKGHWTDEDAVIIPDENLSLLFEIEAFFLFLETFDWKTCILRLANVYEGKKDLIERVKSKESKKLPGNGQQYLNLIHLNDVLSCLTYALNHNLEGIYNLCEDDHPTKKELYEKLAKESQLSPPIWEGDKIVGNNIRASNHKIKAEGFSLSYPNKN